MSSYSIDFYTSPSKQNVSLCCLSCFCPSQLRSIQENIFFSQYYNSFSCNHGWSFPTCLKWSIFRWNSLILKFISNFIDTLGAFLQYLQNYTPINWGNSWWRSWDYRHSSNDDKKRNTVFPQQQKLQIDQIPVSFFSFTSFKCFDQLSTLSSSHFCTSGQLIVSWSQALLIH